MNAPFLPVISGFDPGIHRGAAPLLEASARWIGVDRQVKPGDDGREERSADYRFV